MLDIIKSKPGCSVRDVCHFFDVSRIAVMKHLNVLEKANLIRANLNGSNLEEALIQEEPTIR